jgi:hypothetical protein
MLNIIKKLENILIEKYYKIENIEYILVMLKKCKNLKSKL